MRVFSGFETASSCTNWICKNDLVCPKAMKIWEFWLLRCTHQMAHKVHIYKVVTFADGLEFAFLLKGVERGERRIVPPTSLRRTN